MFTDLEKNIGDINFDLNKYKWILGTGCSYGAMVRSVLDPFDLLQTPMGDIPKKKKKGYPDKIHCSDDLILSINVPLSGHGVKWQSDSIIYLTNFLLKNGVNPENIYCFVEWSQWTRETVHLTHLLNLDFNSIEFTSFTKLSHDVRINYSQNGNPIDITTINDWPYLERFLNKINISTSEPGGASVGQVGGNVHFSIYNTDSTLLGNELGYDYKFLLEESRKLTDSTPIEFRIKNYLETILHTQNFLKLNNVSYNFIQMQSDFDRWVCTNGKIKHFLTHNIHLTEELIYGNYSSDNFIENVFPQFKYIFDQIDLNNFWFYKNKFMQRGGIDEWVLSEFGDSAYSYVLPTNILGDRVVLDDNQIDDKLPRFGNHPIELLYILIWNEAASNCSFLKINTDLENWIRELYFEDYNYEGDSKNFFVLSKNYIERLKKIRKL